MAKKKTSTSARKAKRPEGVAAKVILDAFDGPSQYVNHAEITHSRHEFIFVFAQIAVKQSRAQLEAITATGELVVEPCAQLMFPPTLIEGLIKALTSQKEKYEQEHGKISEE